jgi:radical SAM protein with 4Fe4S-binding SPASM domain
MSDSIRENFTDSVYDLIGRALSPNLARALRLMSGQSLRTLGSRSARIWRLARSILRGDRTNIDLPVRLQVETTDICNLKCLMCTRDVLDDMDTTTMSLEWFQKLVDEVNPFYATLNGLGEPLIDKTIFDKLAYLHESNIFTAMPTNGSFVEGKRLSGLVDNFPDVLTLSIDGATKDSFETIRELGNFERITANARGLIEARRGGQGREGRLKILCALQKANLHDFSAMWELVDSMGIEEFNLVPMFDPEPDSGAYTELIPSRDEAVALQAAVDDHLRSVTREDERAFMMQWRNTADAWVEAKDDEGENRHACAIPWFSSYVDAKGRVFPCCFLLATSHVMGNVNDESFTDIWNGETYQEFRHELMTNRPALHGCNTCWRNDDAMLDTLRRHKYLLFAEPAEPEQIHTPADERVRLPLVG